jgi:type III secretion protein V
MIIAATRSEIGNLPPTAQKPVLLVDGEIRRFVRKVLNDSVPDIQALSYNQLTPDLSVQPLGTIALKNPNQLEDHAAELVQNA